MSRDWNVFDRIEATFMPTRLDNLKPDAFRLVGCRCVWRYAFTLDPEEGPYGGQAVFWVDGGTANAAEVGWVPECDLADVVHLEPAKGSHAPAPPESEDSPSRDESDQCDHDVKLEITTHADLAHGFRWYVCQDCGERFGIPTP